MSVEVKRKRPPSVSQYFGVKKNGEHRVQAIEIPPGVLADRDKRVCSPRWRTLGDYLQGCPQFGYSALDRPRLVASSSMALRPTVKDPLEVWRVREWVRKIRNDRAFAA